MNIHGSCHCGNIAFTLRWTADPVEIPARACDCSFCVKHGGVWTSHPSSSLSVAVKNPSLVTKYSFGTRTAQFHTCTGCGAVPVVTSQIGERTYAVVSVNAFDGEGADARLTRRQRNWIADVQFEVDHVD